MAIALAAVIILLVIGSVYFHFASIGLDWFFTPLASNWNMIDRTVDITFIVTGIVFVAVNLFTAYCIIKYKHKPGQKADYDPENKKLEIILTAVTATGVALMLTPGLLVWGDFVNVPDDALRVETMAKQWHWSYRFPGEDGEFGDTDIHQMNVDNPFGIDPTDPAGQDDILVSAPILHLPLNQSAHVLIRSTDVLHNFTVPQFRVKMDAVPGMITYQWFEPTVAGTYDVLCEELCGIGHFAMRSKVVVEPMADFNTWLDAQPTFAETQARPVGDAAAGQGTFATCSACHGQQGEGNQATFGPRLADQDAWYIRRQIANFQNGYRGASPDDQYGVTMAPMAALVTNEQTLENVIAYIETLPDEPAAQTITGDVEVGRQLFETCASCHGPKGEGRWNTNAPRLAGMSDWYLRTQLMHFKEGIRGGHPDDIYGAQMGLVGIMLKDDSAIDDVIAYINTLNASE